MILCLESMESLCSLASLISGSAADIAMTFKGVIQVPVKRCNSKRALRLLLSHL